MSISPIIDTHYRLQPPDLGRQERVVTIQNVSRQGLETLAPVLHFREFPNKRLLLTPIQCRELTQITGTTYQEDWIGHQVLLAVQSDRDQLRIHLFSPPKAEDKRGIFSTPVHLPAQMGNTLLLLLLLLLLFAVALVLDDNSVFWQWIGFA